MNEETLQYLEANSLTSFMNKTKWNELANGLTSNEQFEPVVSIKILREKEASGFSLLDWEWVKHGNSSCIEWIEIDPIKRESIGRLVKPRETDYSEFVLSVLLKFNIPYSVNGNNYLVRGYASANNQPKNV
ncbi:DUF6678 family protein [Saccharophagus degradans]|uniref:Uncharacterized protein n=1 Tax=Saccharophagus degradans (strain 2-40 / ATCC 43961 / DSM 17024) TaxID=203122 RepID=Q21NN7_SACD2|nr:DUF6678 family protein [Saccharophagus degradans]ABD79692.1 conserved hypothetical protein [Saccharophagus degradans 2-40]